MIYIAKELSKAKVNYVYLDDLSSTNLEVIRKYSPTKTLPLMQAGEYNIAGTVPIAKYLLNLNQSVSKILLGGENLSQVASIEMWVDFVNFKIRPFYDYLVSPILSGKEANAEVTKIAFEDLANILSELNQYLTLKSFLVEHSVTFADIFLAVNLHPYYTLLFDEAKRAGIANVTRHYFYIANMKLFTTVFGNCRLCKESQKPSVVPLTKLIAPVTVPAKEAENKNNNNKDNKDNKNAAEAKKEQKPNAVAAKKPEPVAPKKQEKETEDEEKEDKRKKNELDLLPPSTFDLDSFKKEFMNSKERAQVLKNFWSKYDSQGFSLWYIHYQKCGDQGKILFKTTNLKTLFLQKLDKLRRYAFAVHGVYGNEPELEVEGVWMVRGVEIPSMVINFKPILNIKNIFICQN